MKKYVKEIATLLITIFIITNLVSIYKSKDVDAKSSLKLLESRVDINGIEIEPLIKQRKPLVINFWGTWCPVCNQEVSNIDKIAKDGDIILITVAVNSGSDKEIKEFMEKKGVNFIVVNDNSGEIAKAFNISTYPTTIFYSPDRERVIKDSGYLTYGGYLIRKKLVGE